MWRRLLLIHGVCLLSGCIPIELDVSKDGTLLFARQEGFFTFNPATNKAQKLYDKSAGHPLFARYAPNGTEFLAVTRFSLLGESDSHFFLIPLKGGERKRIYGCDKAISARFSPDGTFLAISRGASDNAEISLLDLKTGKSRDVIANVAYPTRWTPDSKYLLVFQLGKKKTKDGELPGHLTLIDVATDARIRLCAVSGDQPISFDVSPDGKKILFTAYSIVESPEKQPRKVEKPSFTTLYEYDVATGKIHLTNRRASWVAYSPSGKKVLLGSAYPDGPVKYEVVKADMTDARTVASNGAFPDGAGWIDEDNTYYLMSRFVYGPIPNVNLTLVPAVGGKRRCVQPLIDLEALKDFQ